MGTVHALSLLVEEQVAVMVVGVEEGRVGAEAGEGFRAAHKATAVHSGRELSRFTGNSGPSFI